MRRIIAAIRAKDDERGVALAAVIGIGMVVMVLVATITSIAVSGSSTSGSDRNYANAMSAAYAGLADYQSKVNANSAYATLYGDSTAAFSTGDTFANGKGGNPAFDSWVAVPNADGSAGTTYYRYEVDNSVYAQQGLVRVQVTGKAGTTTRTLVANVKPDGFSNYLYWTNYESGDPAVTGENCVNVIQNANYTNSPGGGKSACSRIQFASGDILSGPVRSNDVLLICGADFKNTVQSAVGWSQYGCTGTTPKFEKGNPTIVSTYTPPSTIAGGKNRMNSDDPTVATVTANNPGTGCLYTGPTKIVYNGDGTMTVTSPLTVVTNLSSNGTSGSTPSKCGAIADLHGNGATVNELAGNLIYVQNEPASSSDPNYYAKFYKTSATTPACFKSATTTDNGVGYPMTTTITTGGGWNKTTSTVYESKPINNNNNTSTSYQTAYGCADGDLFVEGTYTQAQTIDAENYVYVTNDLVYPTNRTTSTVLGIVGQEAVFVYNPVYNGTSLLSDSSRTIDAAILSNQGTFMVENYAVSGNRGYLYVNGSIAQDYRGAVGTSGGTGYLKSYGYDNNLLTYSPPFFPQPVVTTYKVASQVETKPAFDANGNPLS
jgi:outer membrane lipoprotein-sorting protein